MTNPTPHGQVPEALIDLIDAYAETRHRCCGIYNAKTEAARNAVIEALSGVQALSAAPANHNASRALQGLDFIMRVYEPCMGKPAPDEEMATIVEATKRLLLGWWGEHRDTVRAMLAASPTPPAEQTADPDGEAFRNAARLGLTLRFYGSCAQSSMPGTPSAYVVTQGSDRAEAMREAVEQAAAIIASGGEAPKAPLAPPAEQQAAPKAAPGESLTRDQIREVFMAHGFTVKEGHTDLKQYVYDAAYALLAMGSAPKAAPGEPGWWRKRADEIEAQVAMTGSPEAMRCYTDMRALLHAATEAAPQPAPAPLSEMPYEKRKAIQEGEQISASDAWFKARHEMLDTLDRRNVFRAGFDRGWSAALAAQGGKCPMRIEP